MANGGGHSLTFGAAALFITFPGTFDAVTAPHTRGAAVDCVEFAPQKI